MTLPELRKLQGFDFLFVATVEGLTLVRTKTKIIESIRQAIDLYTTFTMEDIRELIDSNTANKTSDKFKNFVIDYINNI